ncbi:MAG: hypothetical protein KF863_17070 [Rubrivivax sp.]|nr:hypothetical protein [Rubrivivax sp.]
MPVAVLCVAASGVHAQAALPRVELRREAVAIDPTLDCRVRVSMPDGRRLPARR